MDLLMSQPLDAAYYLHLQIYSLNPHIRAIVHTHSQFVSLLTSLDQFKIKPVHQNSCRFLRNTAYDTEYGQDI